MGCDIHPYVEYKRGEVWSCLAANFSLERSYTLFGRIAGIRGDKNALYALRGLPNDISCSVRDHSHEYNVETDSFHILVDWHDYGWLTADEFIECMDKEPERVAEANNWKIFRGLLLEVQRQYGREACRVVFWFDS